MHGVRMLFVYVEASYSENFLRPTIIILLNNTMNVEKKKKINGKAY